MTDRHIPSGDAGPPEGLLGRSMEAPAPQMARLILHAALLCYMVITVLNIVGESPGAVGLALALTAMAAIYALQLVHSRPNASRVRTSRKWLTLSAQALLTALPLLLFGTYWGSMAGFLSGSLLLVLPARLAWTLYGAVGLIMLVPPTLDGWSVAETFYVAQSSLLTGLVVFGLTRLAELVQVVHGARAELAKMAVTRERLRFARDLHDLLGYSLSAITLKGELIHRLIPTQPDRAMVELDDVLATSRQALADVRVVASGYRDLSLAEEIDSARSTLEAAGVVVNTFVDPGAVSPPVETVLATVLREAVTNVLRHSTASRCEIAVTRADDVVRLSVSNDGAPGDAVDPSPYGGSGLDNLDARLRAVEGVLTWTHPAEGSFRVVALAPADGPADGTAAHARAKVSP